MLEGTARSWIENLPEKSVHSWRDMERVFTQHFHGTYRRPNTYTDLTRCVQKPEDGHAVPGKMDPDKGKL